MKSAFTVTMSRLHAGFTACTSVRRVKLVFPQSFSTTDALRQSHRLFSASNADLIMRG